MAADPLTEVRIRNHCGVDESTPSSNVGVGSGDRLELASGQPDISSSASL